MIDRSLSLNISKQCDLLSIHRGGLYYKPVSISEENLAILDFLDKQYLDTPFKKFKNPNHTMTAMAEGRGLFPEYTNQGLNPPRHTGHCHQWQGD